MKMLKQLIRALVVLPFRALPVHLLQNLIVLVAARRAQSLSPGDGLRFLFTIDALLYPVQGALAVAYGGGVHTKHRHMRYHDFFVNRVRSGERVLDIGCGIGAVAHDVAAQVGAEVVGIDLDAQSIETARALYPHPNVRYMVGDALTDLPDEHFDVVILSNVLEHLESRPEFIRNVQAQVRAARWLIRVPLFERDWRVPLKKELGIEWRLDPTHYIEYTLETFAAEMTKAEMRIVHQEVRWGEVWAEVENL